MDWWENQPEHSRDVPLQPQDSPFDQEPINPPSRLGATCQRSTKPGDWGYDPFQNELWGAMGPYDLWHLWFMHVSAIWNDQITYAKTGHTDRFPWFRTGMNQTLWAALSRWLQGIHRNSHPQIPSIWGFASGHRVGVADPFSALRAMVVSRWRSPWHMNWERLLYELLFQIRSRVPVPMTHRGIRTIHIVKSSFLC